MRDEESPSPISEKGFTNSGGTKMQNAVSVVGLGKLGACMATAMASRGVKTIGVDVNPACIEKIKSRVAPVFEPGLAEMIAGCDGLLHATIEIEAAVLDTQMTFVVVPTPSTPAGAFSLQHVCAAMEPIARALREKSNHHTVVLTSTVVPGSTDYVIRPLLEKVSGKRCGPDFGLCYSPEFIALGSVLKDFLNPDLLLIGECDSIAGDRLAAFYLESLGIDAPVARMAPVNAELAKLALNTFVTTKITFANLLAEICERLPGGDVDAVTRALGLDSRIGSKYLKGALGYGGPCFPRDNNALAHLLEEMGVSTELPRTVDNLNRHQPARVAALVEEMGFHPPEKLAILGLAYKPNTNVVVDSQGVAIARHLVEKGYEVSVFDPVATEPAREVLGGKVRYGVGVADCVRNAAVVIIATDWPEFRSVFYQTSSSSPRPLILDAWRLLRTAHGSSSSYRAVGIGLPQRENRERLRRFVEKLARPATITEEASRPPKAEAAAN